MKDENKKSDRLSQFRAELNPRFIQEHPLEAERIYNQLLPREQLKLALERRGKQRMTLLLLSKKARALVRSLPAQELYLTIKEVGEENALELLALASHKQLTYIFDIEFWNQDLLYPARVVKWLNLLRQASPEQIQSWLKQVEPELLIRILQLLVEIFVVDPDNLGAEPWRDEKYLFTLDEYYFFKPINPMFQKIIEQTLLYLRDLDEEKFYGILDQCRFLLGAELEDTAYRVRQGRLEDYGFYSFDEAFEIYQFLSPERMKELTRHPEKPAPIKASGIKFPLALAREIPDLLKQAFHQLSEEEIEDFAHQFASLANKIIVADGMDLTELKNMKTAIEKVYGYLEIGLNVWSEGKLEQAVELLRTQSLQHIFQVGFSQVLKLRFKAQKIEAQDWFQKLGKPFFIFGEIDGARIQALLAPRPKFYSEKKTLALREFRSLNELKLIEKSLENAELWGNLFFQVLGLKEENLKKLMSVYPSDLNFQVVLATFWVQGIIKKEPCFAPVEISDLEKFIQQAMTPRRPPRHLQEHLKEEFISWLCQKYPSNNPEQTEQIKNLARATIEMVEEELGALKNLKKINPEIISCLVLNI